MGPSTIIWDRRHDTRRDDTEARLESVSVQLTRPMWRSLLLAYAASRSGGASEITRALGEAPVAEQDKVALLAPVAERK
jgi:hypothetical protein